MNIVVCLKAVPTSTKNPTIVGDGYNIQFESYSFIMNESDEYALEQALLLKKSFGGSVTAVTVGSLRSQEVLYVSLAKGADRAIRVDRDEFDANVVSLVLARAVGKLGYDLILAGVESLDGMSSQVAISLASELGLPYVYAVTKIELGSGGGPLLVDRELGGGRYQTLEICMPALLCIQSGIVPLTYAPPVKLIQARRSATTCLSLSDLGITEHELARRRKARVVGIKPREKSSTTQLLTGSPEKLAHDIFDKIKRAL